MAAAQDTTRACHTARLRKTLNRDNGTSRLEDELAALHEKSTAWALACTQYDRAEAEDVLQTAYLEILDGRAHFAGRSSFKTFVFGVIRRVALARERRRTVRGLLLGRFGEAGAPAADPEKRLVESQRAADVRKALVTLARRQREVLELVFYQELTVDEAASVMDVSVGSARVHYHRGKENLLAVLTEIEK